MLITVMPGTSARRRALVARELAEFGGRFSAPVLTNEDRALRVDASGPFPNIGRDESLIVSFHTPSPEPTWRLWLPDQDQDATVGPIRDGYWGWWIRSPGNKDTFIEVEESHLPLLTAVKHMNDHSDPSAPATWLVAATSRVEDLYGAIAGLTLMNRELIQRLADGDKRIEELEAEVAALKAQMAQERPDRSLLARRVALVKDIALTLSIALNLLGMPPDEQATINSSITIVTEAAESVLVACDVTG